MNTLLKKILFTISAWGEAIGCSTYPKPAIALQDIQFAEYPYIIEREENYFLHYRIAINSTQEVPLRRMVYVKKTKDKGYYYFSIPISHPEYGNGEERSLSKDGLTEFARQDAIYWLNPDGSEIHLEIKN